MPTGLKARFNYNDSNAVLLSLDYATKHRKCPECLGSPLNVTEKTEDGYTEVELSCPFCKRWEGAFGFSEKKGVKHGKL